METRGASEKQRLSWFYWTRVDRRGSKREREGYVPYIYAARITFGFIQIYSYPFLPSPPPVPPAFRYSSSNGEPSWRQMFPPLPAFQPCSSSRVLRLLRLLRVFHAFADGVCREIDNVTTQIKKKKRKKIIAPLLHRLLYITYRSACEIRTKIFCRISQRRKIN